MGRAIVFLLVAAAVALAAATAVLAGDGKEQIKFNPADQAAARAVVIRRADLGSSGWTGGPRKPDLSSGPSCPDYHPKVSDLVLTGVSCLRRTIGKGLGSNAKVVSFRKLPFPQIAAYAALFRGVISVSAQGRTVRILTDVVLVGRSRTELTLTIVGPASAKSSISAAERRLARALDYTRACVRLAAPWRRVFR